jgi:arsenite-transporting ATPase
VRVVLYTGKGGVGKTTTAAATAVVAAARGIPTLVVSADAAHSLGDVLGQLLDDEAARLAPVPVAERLYALEIDARRSMERHWGRVRDYLVSLFRYQGIEEVVAEELALLPGAEELSTLLAIEELAASRRYELVVVDCAPTGSSLRLLSLPEVADGTLRWVLRLQQALSRVVTPLARNLVPAPLPGADVFRDAEQLLYRKLDALRRRITGAQTSVRLVLTPERMVIEEARRAHSDLALFDVSCDGVVMNRLLPEAACAEDFFRDWGVVQEERFQEVTDTFAPLPILRAPLQDDEVVGLERLRAHGEALFGELAPEALLCRAPRPRFSRVKGGYRLSLPLPGARAEALDVAKLDDELLVTSGGRRRAIPLPRRVAALELAGARLDRGRLQVRFQEAVAEGR